MRTLTKVVLLLVALAVVVVIALKLESLVVSEVHNENAYKNATWEEHVVGRNETLWGLTEDLEGSTGRWVYEVKKKNNMGSGIIVGDKILIPEEVKTARK